MIGGIYVPLLCVCVLVTLVTDAAVVVPTCVASNKRNGICYALAHADNKSTWDNGVSACTTAGTADWAMAIVNHIEIKNLLVNGNVFQAPIGGDEYWIAAKQTTSHYRWQPEDTKTEDGWEGWSGGAPPSSGGLCAYGNQAVDHYWYNADCNSPEHLVLCELDTANVVYCSPDPCVNGGTCQAADGSCTCQAGYTGTICETDIDECVTSPCSNNGTCTDGVNSRTCECVVGFNGTDCEINIDECATSPCLNNGTCIDGVNSRTCECVIGTNGTDCETDIDDCASSPCANGGTCTDNLNSYTCQCVNRFVGTTCTNGYKGNFALVTGILQFEVARNLCRAKCPDCDLADILDDEEKTRLKEVFEYYTSKVEAWIGLYRIGEMNGQSWAWVKWTWVRSGVQVRSRYPIGSTNGQTEKCARMSSTDDSNIGHDTQCTSKYGHICEGDFVDPCEPNPCHVDSICSHIDYGPLCRCPTSETPDCDAANPCNNASACVNGDCNWNGHNSYLCTCNNHFSGEHCDSSSLCDDTTPCQNDGNCSANNDSYTCDCPEPYGGNNCQYAECGQNLTVANGLVSFPWGTRTNTSARYSCHTRYQLNDNSLAVTCGQTGDWEGMAPVCICSTCGLSTNLALGKPTSSRSVATSNAGSSKAVDGDLDTSQASTSEMNACYKAGSGSVEWLAVNLEQDVEICQVRILNRDSTPYRLQDTVIGVTDVMPADGDTVTENMLTQICTTTPSSLTVAGEWLDLTCETCVVTGSVIVLLGSTNLQLCELEVYGSIASAVTTTESDTTQVITTHSVDTTTSPAGCESGTNLAFGRPTARKSEYGSSWPSSRAVDGDLNTMGFGANGCFYSYIGADQWLAVDLQAEVEVCGVAVLNRDYYPERLENVLIGMADTMPSDGETFTAAMLTSQCTTTPSTMTASQWFNATCDNGPVTGSVILLIGGSNLHVCELQVYGHSAIPQTTAQASTTSVDTSTASQTTSSGDTQTGTWTTTEAQTDASTGTTSDPQVTTTDSQVTTTESQGTTTESRVSTSESQVTTSESQVTTTDSQVTTTNSQVTTTDSQVTTTDSQVTTTNSQVTTTDSQVTTTNSQVTTTDSQVTNTESQVTTTQSQETITQSSSTQDVTTLQSTTEASSNGTGTISQVTSREAQVTSQVNTSESQVTTSTSSPTTTTAGGFTTTTPAPSLKCSTPIIFPNSDIIESYPFINGYVMYQCKPGFEYGDGTRSRGFICDMDQYNVATWHAQFVDCQAKTCEPVEPPLENAVCEVSAMTAGVRMVCSCPEGMFFANGRSTAVLQCEDRKVWNRHPGSCLARCTELPLIKNARIANPTGHENTVGSQVEVECLIGHRYAEGERSKQMTCLSNREWQDIGICYVDTCPTMTHIQNSTLNTTITIYNTHLQITCNEGYTFTPGVWIKVLLCLVDGIWNDSVTHCVPIECPPIPVVENADSVGSDTHYHAMVQYSCHSGLGLPGYQPGRVMRQETGYVDSSITCLQNSNWSVPVISCQFGRCYPVPAVTHAVPDSDQATADSVVIYTCETGYTFADNTKTQTIQCENSEWNVTHYQCQVVNCPRIENIHHASFPPTNDTVYLTTVEISCNVGHTVLPESDDTVMLAQCTDSQAWQVVEVGNHTALEESEAVYSLPSACSIVHCGPLPTVYNSRTPVTFSDEYGTLVSVSCKPGYWFMRNVFVQDLACRETAAWEPAITDCVPIQCVSLPTWQGATVDNPSISIGAVVNISCSLLTNTKELIFEDNTQWVQTVCLPTGVWEPAVPNCIDISNFTAVKAPPVEAEKATEIGTVTISIFMVPLAAVIIADIVTGYSLLLIWARNARDGWLNIKDFYNSQKKPRVWPEPSYRQLEVVNVDQPTASKPPDPIVDQSLPPEQNSDPAELANTTADQNEPSVPNSSPTEPLVNEAASAEVQHQESSEVTKGLTSSEVDLMDSISPELSKPTSQELTSSQPDPPELTCNSEPSVSL